LSRFEPPKIGAAPHELAPFLRGQVVGLTQINEPRGVLVYVFDIEATEHLALRALRYCSDCKTLGSSDTRTMGGAGITEVSLPALWKRHHLGH
jgi:hypothetical protein